MATAIQPSQNLTMTFGGRDDIAALSNRIRAMVPGGNKLANEEAMALAQVSLVCGLNPFIGEVWYIPGKGPMVGIRGARRYAKEQIEREGGQGAYYWMDTQPCAPQEAGADPAEVHAAFRCDLYDSVSTANYLTMLTSTIEQMRSAGASDPVGEARKMIGPKPCWTGYGFSTKGESTKMNKTQVARKRAESDAIKKRFSIPFGAGVSEYDDAKEGDVVDATVTQVTQADPEPEAQTEAVRPYSPADLQIAILRMANTHAVNKREASSKQRGLVASVLEQCFAPDPAADKVRHSVQKYLTGSDSITEMPAAKVLALLDWLKPTKDSSNAYMPDAMAEREARLVWSEALKAAGQEQLL